MRKPFLILTAVSLLSLMFSSCAEEEILGDKTVVNDTEFMEAKLAPPPDLIIDTLFTDIQFQSTLCTDTLMLTTHCDFGDAARSFNAFAVIRNIGVGTLPAGTIEVQWNDTHGPSFTTTVSHGGLPPQATTTATRPYYLGPCDFVQLPNPSNCYIRSYSAFVDPNDLIVESNEGNNASNIVDTCDGCGPCPVISEVVEPLEP